MTSPAPPIELRQGQCFRFAVPRGWHVGEEGPFAVTVLAPDRSACTIMVGNAGLPVQHSPGQYLWDTLARLQLTDLRFGPPRPAPPALGFPHAWDHDVQYGADGVPCVGVAKVSAAPAYDTVTLVMTFAAAHADRWPSFASWLPHAAAQVQATHPGVFGAQGIAQQSLRNSMALGQQAQQHREWSAATWAEVARQREQSQERVAAERGQALRGHTRYDNPYDGRPIDLPSANAAYWVHPTTGQIVGHPDPTFDPRTPVDGAWRRLTPRGPEAGSST